MEHVLGPLSLPGRVHVKVVKLSTDRSERDGDRSIWVGRIEDPVLLPRCAQPQMFSAGTDWFTPRKSPPKGRSLNSRR